MNCYGKDPYDIKMEKQTLIKKGKYLLHSKCCDSDCEVLIKDIEKTADDCHSLFRDMHLDDLDSEGKITTVSLCSELDEKKSRIQEQHARRSEGTSPTQSGGIIKKRRTKRSNKQSAKRSNKRSAKRSAKQSAKRSAKRRTKRSRRKN